MVKFGLIMLSVLLFFAFFSAIGASLMIVLPDFLHDLCLQLDCHFQLGVQDNFSFNVGISKSVIFTGIFVYNTS
jgi:hypothetical protein